MRVSPEFVKTSIRAVQAHLAGQGFVKRKFGIMTLKKSESVIGWVGLNKATRGREKFLELNPVVGIRNQDIERLVADLTGDQFDDVVPATLGGNIGYLMPSNEYRPYCFSEEVTIESVAGELIADVSRYGMPFISKNLPLEALLEAMQTCRFAIKFMVAYRIPAALFLLNRDRETIEAVQEELAKIGHGADPASLRYKTFANNLVKRVETR